MNVMRNWIFRLLVVIGGCLLVYAWFTPWWSAYIVELDHTAVVIYPHSFVADMGNYPHWLMGADEAMPSWFFVFMWVYFAVVIAALLFSLFASSQKRINIGKLSISLPTALVSGVGLSYVVVVIAAVITISLKASNFYGASLMGSIFISMSDHEESWVDFGLQMGFWLACAAAIFLLVLGLTRRFVVGKENS